MIHSKANYLLKKLKRSGQAERRELSSGIVWNVINQKRGSARYLREVASIVLGQTPPQVDSYPEDEYPSISALNLIRNGNRIDGYVDAMKVALDGARRVVDVGTGPGALLALIGVQLNPGIEKISAIEANARSAECARKLIELFGLEDQIEVIHGDGLSMSPIESDVMVTKAFSSGLMEEPGVLIAQHYAEAAGTCLPDGYSLRAIVSDRVSSQLRKASWLDMGNRNFHGHGEMIEGRLPFVPARGVLSVLTLPTFRGSHLIEPYGDVITYPRSLRLNFKGVFSKTIAEDSVGIDFMYPHSKSPFETLRDLRFLLLGKYLDNAPNLN
ncbi:methyltransferase [Candidatus Saccharibacteria bacterium]|nr:methyltransferase [Candidatus Saccharibacteria bacterium]